MQIKQSTYDQLSPQQRMVATFEALSRSDQEEANRLFESCPMKRYRMTDSEYTDLHNRVLDQMLIIEYKLLSLSLWILHEERLGTEKSIKFVEILRQKMANIQAGWEALLEELGLRIEIIEGQFIDRSPILELVMARLPSATPEGTACNLADYRQYVINGKAPTQAC